MLKRIALLLACLLLLFVSWSAVLKVESPTTKQEVLISLAKGETDNGTSVNAVPYLVEAIGYNGGLTVKALTNLKDVYFSLGKAQEYVKTLKQLTSHADCPATAYKEFALYYISQDRLADALSILRAGIERTNEQFLKDVYEEHRYTFTFGRDAFEDVTAYHNGGAQVKMNGLWGLANTSGKVIIPCAYEQISTYDSTNNGCVVALQADKKVVTVNLDNQPIATSDLAVEQVGNLSQDIIPLQLNSGKWIIANSKLISTYTEYDCVGTPSNSAVAIMVAGKWGVTSLDGEMILPCEYDEVIMDELGRCYAQDAVFAKKDGRVYLFVNGEFLAEAYEDARPFTDDGWAAVKQNGKWGFIDTSGALIIEPRFDDALSFSGHLAAIKQGELWGYVALTSRIAIEPQFLQAKSFFNGCAPVLTEQGWQFITLLEHKKGAII